MAVVASGIRNVLALSRKYLERKLKTAAAKEVTVQRRD